MKFAKNLKIRIGLDPEYFMCFDTSFMYGTCCYTQFYGKCTINLCMCYTIWFEWLEPKHRYLKYKWMLTCPQLFFGFRFWVIDAKQFLHFRVKMFWHSLQGAWSSGRGGERGAHANCELNNYCKQWSISDRSERGAVHQMDRTCSACQEKQRERGKQRERR